MKKRTDKLTILIIIFAVIVALLAIVLKVLPALSGGSGGKTITEKLKSGQKYLSEMDYDQAIAAFNEALEIDDRNTEAYVGLGDAYTGKEDWTPAVTNYDEAIETVAEQAPVDAVSADEIASVRDAHTEITYAEEDEWALMAALEDNEDLEIPGILIDTINADYVEDIIVKRNNALYEGVQIFLLPEAESNDYHAWLEVVMHPEYVPEEVPEEDETADDNIEEEDKADLIDVDTVLDEYLDTIVESYPVVDTESIYSIKENPEEEYSSYKPGWDNSDLTGVLSAYIDDFDKDGESELLTIRIESYGDATDLNSVSVAEKKRSPDDPYLADRPEFDTKLILEIYEVEKSDGSVVLKGQKELSGLSGIMTTSLLSLQIDCFIYEYNGEMYIGVDSFEREEGATFNIAVYQYKEEKISFVKEVTYSQHGGWGLDLYKAEQEREIPLNLEWWDSPERVTIARVNREDLDESKCRDLFRQYKEELQSVGINIHPIETESEYGLMFYLELPEEVEGQTDLSSFYEAENIVFLSLIQNRHENYPQFVLDRVDTQGLLNRYRNQ